MKYLAIVVTGMRIEFNGLIESEDSVANILRMLREFHGGDHTWILSEFGEPIAEHNADGMFLRTPSGVNCWTLLPA